MYDNVEKIETICQYKCYTTKKQCSTKNISLQTRNSFCQFHTNSKTRCHSTKSNAIANTLYCLPQKEKQTVDLVLLPLNLVSVTFFVSAFFGVKTFFDICLLLFSMNLFNPLTVTKMTNLLCYIHKRAWIAVLPGTFCGPAPKR